MKVAITYEIWEHGGEVRALGSGMSKRIVGPHTVVHECATEADAKASCEAMCKANFPDTAYTSREYIISTSLVNG